MSEDSSKLVFDVPLGEGWVEDTVKPGDSDYPLMRLLKQCRIIADAQRTSVAWSRAYVHDYFICFFLNNIVLPKSIISNSIHSTMFSFSI